MRFRLFLLFVILFSVKQLPAQESHIPMLSFQQFEKYLNQKSDTIYVINFWATWCGPCRSELPAFERIHLDHARDKVKVLLVSLDFPKELDNTLRPYLKSNRITASVVLLNDPDSNAWIDKVSPEWTGAIPATLIYKGLHKVFFEHELSYQDINNSILSLINL